MTTYTTYEIALDILMKISSTTPDMRCGLWVSEDNYRKISTEYITNIYKCDEFCYYIKKNINAVFINFNNGSKLNIIKCDKEQNSIRGQRYDLLFIDADITTSDVFHIGRTVCTTLLQPGPFSFEVENSCNKCLCKTCSLAYENGGAEGCGDCLKCRTEMKSPTLTCKDYYNPQPPRIDYKRRNI